MSEVPFARICAVASLWATSLAIAQIAPPPEFEVASLKPAAGGRLSMRGGPGTGEPERIAFENVDLRRLLVRAYGVEVDQISGPGWIDSEKYTIAAKLPAGTSVAQFQTMLQNLLTERLTLKLHHETKEFSAYELTVAKNGPKLIPAAARDPNDTEPDRPPYGTPATVTKDKEGCPVVRPGVSSGSGSFGPGVSCSRFSKTTLPDFAKALENFVAMQEGTFGTQDKTHVVDKTGIQGDFDITLKFHFAPRFPGQQPLTPGVAGDPDVAEGPSLATALEQQLGLKLQRSKTILDRIVIDSANRVPAEN